MLQSLLLLLTRLLFVSQTQCLSEGATEDTGDHKGPEKPKHGLLFPRFVAHEIIV